MPDHEHARERPLQRRPALRAGVAHERERAGGDGRPRRRARARWGSRESTAMHPAEHDGVERQAGAHRLRAVLDEEGDRARGRRRTRAGCACRRCPGSGPSWAMLPWMPRKRERRVEQDAGQHLEAERDREQHAQHVAERPHGLQRVADVADRRRRGRPAPPRDDPAPERVCVASVLQNDAHQRPAEEGTSVVGHEAHERDLAAPGDQHPDRERAQPGDDRGVGHPAGEALDRDAAEHRAEGRRA